eukprot:767771-Hanusia_phi.AAC.3
MASGAPAAGRWQGRHHSRGGGGVYLRRQRVGGEAEAEAGGATREAAQTHGRLHLLLAPAESLLSEKSSQVAVCTGSYLSRSHRTGRGQGFTDVLHEQLVENFPVVEAGACKLELRPSPPPRAGLTSCCQIKFHSRSRQLLALDFSRT